MFRILLGLAAGLILAFWSTTLSSTQAWMKRVEQAGSPEDKVQLGGS